MFPFNRISLLILECGLRFSKGNDLGIPVSGRYNLTPTFQGFGRCGLEAMACGTACVLTNAGGVSEYARDGENSLLVPPGRPEAFAQAIVTILKDPTLKQRLFEAGLTTARAYCYKREARETLAYFHNGNTGRYTC